jgi:hypothetical protein
MNPILSEFFTDYKPRPPNSPKYLQAAISPIVVLIFIFIGQKPLRLRAAPNVLGFYSAS